MPPTKEAPATRQNPDRTSYDQRFSDGLRELGITSFPVYKTAEDFARQFHRCSILTTEKISFSSNSGSSDVLPPKK